MGFDIITIFPHAFDSYFNASVLGRAREKKLIKINIWNLRDFASDKYRKARPTRWSYGRVDDRPYGGGAGMVLKADPIIRAVAAIKRRGKTKIILTSARGKQLTQEMSSRWGRTHKNLIIICGHYEGIDERVKLALRQQGFPVEEISIGPYVLTGGELPAMVIVDAIARHIPGVLGKRESLEEIKGSYPVYTRPELIRCRGKSFRVPSILLSGDHVRIDAWRTRRGRKGALRS